jgi:hypothetical protein
MPFGRTGRNNFKGEQLGPVFPPVRAVSRALSLIEQHAISALIVMASGSAANERIQLSQITGAVVSQPFTIPRTVRSLIVSPRVPAEILNPALPGLAVYKVFWP